MEAPVRKINKISVTALCEGMFTVDKAKKFTLLDGETELADAAAKNATTVAIQPFLIAYNNINVLVDAGLGYPNPAQPKMESLLDAEGISAAEINIVLLSHLHKDHTGGLGYFKGDDFILNYPNAKVYIQEKELDFALAQDGNPSYQINVLQAIKNHPNIQLLNENKGTIEDFISFEVVGGHTPFHQVFWFKHDDQIFFYGGDNLPMMGYLKYQSAYKNDYDGRLALDLRKKWETKATAENWEVLFYHGKKAAKHGF